MVNNRGIGIEELSAATKNHSIRWDMSLGTLRAVRVFQYDGGGYQWQPNLELDTEPRHGFLCGWPIFINNELEDNAISVLLTPKPLVSDFRATIKFTNSEKD